MSDSLRRHEESDIAKLAAITRDDHSTIFFHGLAKSGYVRDGSIHIVALKRVEAPSPMQCLGEAVSRDGMRIAYFTTADDASKCRIVLHELRTGEDRSLLDVEPNHNLLSWSWDDTEIAYRVSSGIVAVSTTDRRQRTLGSLPLRINGKPPTHGWNLTSIDWLHQRPELVESGTCRETHQTLLFSSNDSRLLAFGSGAAVSPAGDHIAVALKDSVVVIDGDGSNRRRITSIPPAAFFLPFFKEETFWSKVVWSPSGDRLWFNTIINEEFNSNLYLVDLKTGRRRRVLKNTSVTITAWRQVRVALAE